MSTFFVNIPPEATVGNYLPTSGGTMTGSINMGGYDIYGGGRVAQGVTVTTVTDGAVYTIGNSLAYVLLYSVTSIPTQTTHMPPNPIVGQSVTINCLQGGIDAWTLDTTDGSIFFPAPPTAISAGQTFEYVYVVLGPTKFWTLVAHILDGGPYLPTAGGTLTGALSIQPASSGGLLIGGAAGNGLTYKCQIGDAYFAFFDDAFSPTLDFYTGTAATLTFHGSLLGTAFIGGTSIQGSVQVASQGLLAVGMSVIVATEGGADTAPDVANVVLNAAGALTAYTLTLPTAILDGQLFTVSSVHAIAGFTLTPGGTQTIAIAPTALTAGQVVRLVFKLTGIGPGGVWYPA